MKIVLGLGNPGPVYAGSRHNIGFMVADRLASAKGARFPEEPCPDLQAWAVELPDGGTVLAKPSTFMNRSGRAALGLVAGYEIEPDDFIVVYDDADLPFGRIRIRRQGGAGGHNGVQSLLEELGTDRFPRVRLGVMGNGRVENDLAGYVLSDFNLEESVQLDGFINRSADAVRTILDCGVGAAMNLFNQVPSASPKEDTQPDR